MKTTRRGFIKWLGALAAAGGIVFDDSVKVWSQSQHDEVVISLDEYARHLIWNGNPNSEQTFQGLEAIITTGSSEPTWQFLRDYPEDDLWVGAS